MNKLLTCSVLNHCSTLFHVIYFITLIRKFIVVILIIIKLTNISSTAYNCLSRVLTHLKKVPDYCSNYCSKMWHNNYITTNNQECKFPLNSKGSICLKKQLT